MSEITMRQVIIGVLMACFLFVALVWFSDLGRILFGSVEETPCVANIKIHNTINDLTNEYASTSIACPTKAVTKDKATDEEAKKILAEQMAWCWWTWGEGNYTLFQEEEGVYCHVCSMVTLTGRGPVNDIEGYLWATQYDDTGLLYGEYLLGVKSGDFFKDDAFRAQAPSSLTTDKPLGVIYYYEKNKEIKDEIITWTAGNPKTGFVVGLASGIALGVVAAKVMAVAGIGALVSGKLLVATGGAAGAVSGTVASILVRPESHYMTGVVVRPLTEENVKDLGCTYLPVGS